MVLVFIVLFACLNSVFGSSACSAMDLIVGGLCVDMLILSKVMVFDNYDENIEVLSYIIKDWFEFFVGVLIGDVFLAV